MRRQVPIAQQLYAYLFPNPSSNDPTTFSVHLSRNLVPEVRIEVATFYGDLNSAEARYPGLNYCHPPHRMRLGRFPHHARLFKAFDHLGFTYSEIQDFCCWEGTRWARERYEKDEGIKVMDTTGDEIKPFVDRRQLQEGEEQRRRSITRKTDISVIVEEAESIRNQAIRPQVDEVMTEAVVAVDHTDVDVEHEMPAEAAPRDRHTTEVQPRRDASLTQQYHARIIAAWEQGHSLSPELDKYLEEQGEGGNSLAGRFLAARRNAAQRAVPAITATPTSEALA